MYPLVFATLGAALIGLWMAVIQPGNDKALRDAQADVYAANFWTYRQALVAYQNNNFHLARGTITDATLSTAYFPLGYRTIRTGTPARNIWNNYIQDGRLYTYTRASASTLPAGVIDAIANYRETSLMIGIKQGNGTITSLFRLNSSPQDRSSFPAPAAANIPTGALVVISN